MFLHELKDFALDSKHEFYVIASAYGEKSRKAKACTHTHTLHTAHSHHIHFPADTHATPLPPTDAHTHTNADRLSRSLHRDRLIIRSRRVRP